MEDLSILGLTNSAVNTIITKLVAKAVDASSNSWTKGFPKRDFQEDNSNFGNKILEHFTEVYKWASNLEFIGLGRPLKMNARSVGLQISFNVRKLTKHAPADDLIQERDLVPGEENFLLLGDPGSGKSTTLKRLLHYFFFTDGYDPELFTYPLLIKFRDIKEYQDLYTYICDMIGIAYQTENISYIQQIEKKKSTKVLMTESENSWKLRMKNKEERGEKVDYNIERPNEWWDTRIETYLEEETKTRQEHFINGERMELALPKLFGKNKVLLVMDGLDEISYYNSEKIQQQIAQLAAKLSGSKIIMTSRPDYIERNLENFSICQVCELDTTTITEISKLWLTDPANFLESLGGKSYFDLAKRPLFLSFLLLLYSEEQSLPYTSKEVYRRIIDQFIVKWDSGRGLNKKSKYSDFDNFKKVEFLTHMAFVLTYQFKKKSFTTGDLRRAYLEIYERFDLPKNQESEVCREIENHTGIIVKAFSDQYEFSHLSIQEYLCALYIVFAGFPNAMLEYLFEYPAPIAMAISLTNKSSYWFSKVAFSFVLEGHTTDLKSNTKIFKIIIRKLLLESPYFDREAFLGVAIMTMSKICDCTDGEFTDLLERFTKSHQNISTSVYDALRFYTYSSIDKKGNRLNLFWRSSFVFEGITNSDHLSTVSLPADIEVSQIIKGSQG